MPETESHEPSKPEEILAEISVFVGGQLEAKFAIEHGEYIIGRDATCHIVVDADQISRHHARLTFSSFELVIEDLSSSNGVFIDGVEVQLPTRIRLGQEVQIGSARLFIQLQESAARQLTDALWDTDLGLGVVRAQLEGLKYRVITTINRGGMGIILQARDLRIRRTVAMKVMKTGSQFSRENVLRFIDEAQLTGQLEHPNIVPVYELGIDEQGETFYTMKFVKGITLDDVLRGIRSGNDRTIEKYPLGTLLTIFQKVCDGVAFAHAKGVVHRDLKPENIMIGSFGEVLVMDWGLAKNITPAAAKRRPKAASTPPSRRPRSSTTCAASRPCTGSSSAPRPTSLPSRPAASWTRSTAARTSTSSAASSTPSSPSARRSRAPPCMRSWKKYSAAGSSRHRASTPPQNPVADLRTPKRPNRSSSTTAPASASPTASPQS